MDMLAYAYVCVGMRAHAHTILRDMKYKPKLYRYTGDMFNYDSLSKSPYYCSQVIKTQFKAEDVLNAAAPAQPARGHRFNPQYHLWSPVHI